MELTLVLIVTVSALVRLAASAQSSVYVKFLSPPHGYSHNLQLSPSGIAISKESRIYPVDNQPFGFQQNHLLNTQPGYTFNKQYQQTINQNNQLHHDYSLNNQYQTLNNNHQFRQGYSLNNQYQRYPQNIQYQPGYPISNLYQQDGSLNNQYHQPQQSTGGYFYSHPHKPFDEYGPPTKAPPPSRKFPILSQPEAELTYDPNLITGPEATRYVNYLFSQGELFFHLIPHERLVLMNQQERIANNLMPHILASIRPGHPFFLHR